MTRIYNWNYLLLFAIALTTSGCYLEQGKLYFDQLGFDPITIYKMAPVERTVYCLAESDKPVPMLDQMHARALAELEANPEQADWSELVCLSLLNEAGETQIRQTINALQLILAVQPKRNHPARGFKRLLDDRLIRSEQNLEQITSLESQKAAQEQEYVVQTTLRDQQISSQQKTLAAQRQKIRELEQQVQKLKEVELILHPKESETPKQ